MRKISFISIYIIYCIVTSLSMVTRAESADVDYFNKELSLNCPALHNPIVITPYSEDTLYFDSSHKHILVLNNERERQAFTEFQNLSDAIEFSMPYIFDISTDGMEFLHVIALVKLPLTELSNWLNEWGFPVGILNKSYKLDPDMPRRYQAYQNNIILVAMKLSSGCNIHTDQGFQIINNILQPRRFESARDYSIRLTLEAVNLKKAFYIRRSEIIGEKARAWIEKK